MKIALLADERASAGKQNLAATAQKNAYQVIRVQPMKRGLRIRSNPHTESGRTEIQQVTCGAKTILCQFTGDLFTSISSGLAAANSVTCPRQLDAKEVLIHAPKLSRYEYYGFAVCNDKMKELISEYVRN